MTALPPKVSVVCAWYNRSSHLCETLDSLLTQTYPNFEIIIVNDGSPDTEVRAILDSYDDPRLRVIHQDNTGFVRTIRRAIAESDGRFIAIMGAGDVCAPHRLTLQADFLERHPDHAIVGCGLRSARIPPRSAEVPHHNWGLAPGEPLPTRGTLARSPTAAELSVRNAFTQGEVMMRRSCYEDVGGYRVFFANTQDLDLWLRLGERYKLAILKEDLYERRIFLSDGIEGDLNKRVIQIAYTQIAELCYRERLRGQRDSVDTYGGAAMIRAPKGLRATAKILRSVKQVRLIGNLELSSLRVVRDLFGPLIYALAYTYALYLWVTLASRRRIRAWRGSAMPATRKFSRTGRVEPRPTGRD